MLERFWGGRHPSGAGLKSVGEVEVSWPEASERSD